MKILIVTLFALNAAQLFGQPTPSNVVQPQTPAAPVKARRRSAAAKAPHSEVALNTLADPGSLMATIGSILLPATAQEAVRVSEEWANSKTIPSIVPDGRVLYPYGRGLPTVVCAPLHVCETDLQAGEKVLGEPQIGDSVRWNVSVVSFGPTDKATPMLIIKPQQSGLDTDLLVTTDRRAYYMRLISQPDTYIARVAFVYPEDAAAEKERQEQAKRKPASAQPKAPEPVVMHYGYQVKGGNATIRPTRVFDDGTKTYLEMPAAMLTREAPVLVIIGPDKKGKGEMVNYRVKDGTYIVDRLFERAELRLGTGKHGQKVEIMHVSKG